MGPGVREVSGRVVFILGRVVVVADGAGGVPPGGRADAQGAVVAPGTAEPGCPPFAQGALVPVPGPGTDVAVGDGTACCDAAMLWVVGGGGTALGSRSQLSKDPNGKCCTTGNLESTSALYILIMPYHPRHWC